jgi:hypothetical protein
MCDLRPQSFPTFVRGPVALYLCLSVPSTFRSTATEDGSAKSVVKTEMSLCHFGPIPVKLSSCPAVAMQSRKTLATDEHR